jgi:hypothetical protein
MDKDDVDLLEATREHAVAVRIANVLLGSCD